MAERKVISSKKGYDGDILSLCNPDEAWSPRYKFDAIKDIEQNLHSYFIEENGLRANISVIIKRGSKRLVTDIKNSIDNKLEKLNNC